MRQDLRFLLNQGKAYECLLTLDATPKSAIRWRFLCARYSHDVLELISEMTETPEHWARIKNPAAIVMSRFKEK